MTKSKIVLTVSELTLASQQLLEEAFPCVWVEGEISNLVRPNSGHLYFSLKDPKSQVRCVLFRQKSLKTTFELRNGLLVQAQVKVSLYPDRGDFQLIVEQIELAGDGLLKQAYEALVKKLSEEGLFDDKWKKPLPFIPNTIGIITSPTGAAIRDILSVLKRRFPQIPVLIYPTKVQGVEAAPEIVKAICHANQYPMVDLLIVARGGGSLEDLWPFNEEIVARAIFESQIPIVTGIGHEIDFTIADFVGDRRAPTPSAAAELITPLSERLLKDFCTQESRLITHIKKFLEYQSQKIDWFLKRIQHPGQQIKNQIQKVNALSIQLSLLIQAFLKEKDLILKNSIRTLETVSPLATLNRGYAIVSDQQSGSLVQSITQIDPTSTLQIRFKDGIIHQEKENWSSEAQTKHAVNVEYGSEEI